MLHPSYTELMKIINQDSEDDTPVINSRYSIVMATAKRARQIIAEEDHSGLPSGKKPLSEAVSELEDGLIRIVSKDESLEDALEISEMADRFVEENIPTAEQTKEILDERAQEAQEAEEAK
jgi:DNA-directed RNA polymerase subunit omega